MDDFNNENKSLNDVNNEVNPPATEGSTPALDNINDEKPISLEKKPEDVPSADIYGERSFYVPPQPPVNNQQYNYYNNNTNSNNYPQMPNQYQNNGYPQTPPPTQNMYNVPNNFHHGSIPTNNFNGNPPPVNNPQQNYQNNYPNNFHNNPQRPYSPNNGQLPPQYTQPYPQGYMNNQPNINKNVPQYDPNQQFQPNYGNIPPYMRDGAVKKSNPLPVILVIIGVIVFLVITGILMSLSIDTNKPTQSPTATIPNIIEDVEKAVVNIEVADKPNLEEKYYEADGVTLTTAGVAKMVSPSVCEIVCYGDTSITPFSKGSGIIMSADGYIITNAHVIEDAKGVKAVLNDGRELKATIIGSDSKTDLAVIQVEADDLTPAVLGNSEQMELGEQVVTIGNPGNLSGTITVGYVSGLKRQIKSNSNAYTMNCIQTDAAVNPGNSGGALVNMYGQVVGIVSSKYVLTGYEGLGFAIEMNEAIPILEDIISKGYIGGRVRIGIVFVGMNEQVASQYGVVGGLLIREIAPECDISNTNLAAGDIITEMNGIPVYTSDDVDVAIEGLEPGDKVTAKVYRPSIITTDPSEEFEIEFELMQDTNLG